MRALLALPFLFFLACSPDIKPEDVSSPQEEQVLACEALARIAKAAAEFRDQGVEAQEFFTRLTKDGTLPQKALDELRGLIDAVYQSELPPSIARRDVLDVCAAEVGE